MKLWAIVAFVFVHTTVLAQNSDVDNKPQPSKNEVKHWFESFSIRGYVQVRYNRLLETNQKLKCEQCDRSIGEGGGFIIRRGRIILSGQIAKNVYFYIQPDFGSSTGSTQNIFQLRDAYFDISFDKNKEYRLRIGQSKVPFGFENMQSSQNRLPLDRNDGLNSALSNERDLGAFFYWAPKAKRELFAAFVKDNLKGSGDYGVFAFGLYNGQTANRAEQNKNLHAVVRLSYPFAVGKQIIEPGIQGYSGKYVLPADLRTAGVTAANNFEFDDKRIATSLILYPKPIGIQFEYNWGRGPQYNPAKDSIETRNLKGGYITLSYKKVLKNGMVFFPFTRLQKYEGGKKHEQDARSYNVKEIETGIECQINKYFEFTTSYVLSERRFEDSKARNNLQKGNYLRLQAQLNF
ncbi:MAG: OprO/OprP family phosphate-selective porin [Ferruginibacter sp.]|nr:OprO/OprP family phosphate-selective porin [Ferruginibacter sp.]